MKAEVSHIIAAEAANGIKRVKYDLYCNTRGDYEIILCSVGAARL